MTYNVFGGTLNFAQLNFDPPIHRLRGKTCCVLKLVLWLPYPIHTHTQSFNGSFSRTTWVGGYQKDKQFWILLKQRWWGGSGISQTICKSICTSLQTDNHASTSPLTFLRAGCLPATQPTASKHWRYHSTVKFLDSQHPLTTAAECVATDYKPKTPKHGKLRWLQESR